MQYEVTLISANIRNPMDGEMRLGLEHDGKGVAEIEYHWDDKQFTAVFHGHAPSMPIPAHPVQFIERPIAAINSIKTEKHRLPSDVFKDNRIYMTIEPQQ